MMSSMSEASVTEAAVSETVMAMVTPEAEANKRNAISVAITSETAMVPMVAAVTMTAEVSLLHHARILREARSKRAGGNRCGRRGRRRCS